MTPLIFSYNATPASRWLLAFKVLALYFIALLNLFEIPHPFWTVDVPTSASDPYVISGLSISALLIAAICVSFKKLPVAAFGLVWFVIYFLPISNLVELNTPMAEHWLYLPMIGLSLAFGTALNALAFFCLPRFQLARAAITGSVCVFLVFGALVVREKTKIYQDDETFLLAAIRANPLIARLYSILGNFYIQKQDSATAKDFYAKALTLDPYDLPANYMLGFLFHQAGQHDKARINLERIARIKPVFKVEFAPVAHAWEMLGDKQKALFYYGRALDIYPDSVEIKQKVANLENQLRPQTSPSVPPR